MTPTAAQSVQGKIQHRYFDETTISVIFDDQIAAGPYTVRNKHDRCPSNESPILQAILDNLEDRCLPDCSILYVDVHRYGLRIRYRKLKSKKRLRRTKVVDPGPMIETLIEKAGVDSAAS